MSKVVVRFVITDVHMGSQHDGLDEVIRIQKRKNPLFAKVLKEDGLVLFLNTSRTRAKLYREGGEVIGYLRTRDGRKLTESTIDLIPQTFGGSVEYAQATKSAFKKFLEIEKAERQVQEA
jgi:hypothetical protein